MRRWGWISGVVAIGVIGAALTSFAADSGAPPARVESVTDMLHGVAVSDPYRWLEDGASAETQAWSSAQSERSRAYLDGLSVRTPIRARIEAAITQSSPRYYGLTYAGGRVFSMYFDPKKQQPILVVMGADADPVSAKTVLDPNLHDTTGATTLDWYVPSHDGKLVALSLSKDGSEDGTLHVFETDTGRETGERIAHVQYPTAGGDVAWAPDNLSFWYTRYPTQGASAEDRHFFQQVYVHRLGDDPAKDAHVFGDGLPKVAEIKLSYSLAANKLLVSVQNGDGGEFVHFVRGEDGQFQQLTHYEDGIDFVAFGPDAGLYLVSEKGAPRRRVLKLAPGVSDLAEASTIVEEGEDAIVIDFWGEKAINFTADKMYVRTIAGGPSRVRVFDLSGKALDDVPLPEVAAVDEIEPVGEDVLYSVETYLRPAQFYRLSAGRSTPTELRATSPISFEDVEVERAFATSKDGTQIPVNIIHKKGMALDGNNPTLLWGYGGYGVSETPFFLGGARRVWFDAGGVFVIANIRGGGEYGETWHRQGSLTLKQNCFDDFIAAAEFLIAKGYTSPAKLALRGGSNGGLLMGAVVTQRPNLARAVVSEVGIYDSVRSELDPNGLFNTTEFGSIKNEEQFRAIYAYSPYHRVKDGDAYPAMFLTTGENDGRVNPMHSRKMAARLQAATGSERPIYLLVRGDTGHGIGTPLSVRIDETADYLAFLFDQLGMTIQE